MKEAKKGKTFIDVNLAEDWKDPARTKRITIADVAEYFSTQARNIASGMRSLAGIHGDWRQIDYIAQDCLEYFKQVNAEGMRKAARKLGLQPRF